MINIILSHYMVILNTRSDRDLKKYHHLTFYIKI